MQRRHAHDVVTVSFDTRPYDTLHPRAKFTLLTVRERLSSEGLATAAER